MTTYERLFTALNEVDIRYLIVGGLAVVLHGVARLTADIDLNVDLAPSEATRTIAALEQHGLRPRAALGCTRIEARTRARRLPAGQRSG